MRMTSKIILALAGLGGAFGLGSTMAAPSLGGSVSPFAFKAKPVGNKPNKVSQKKKRLHARRLNKHK